MKQPDNNTGVNNDVLLSECIMKNFVSIARSGDSSSRRLINGGTTFLEMSGFFGDLSVWHSPS
jgi:hypothetical protein